MKKALLWLALSLLITVAVTGQVQAQSGRLVVINSSSVSYTIYVDGTARGNVSSGSVLRINMPGGRHTIMARSSDGQTSSATYNFTRAEHRIRITDRSRRRSPHTGWAQLTMSNRTTGGMITSGWLDLYVDGEYRCRALSNLFCTTQVRVGTRRFVAKDEDGQVVKRGIRYFRRGESWTWSVE